MKPGTSSRTRERIGPNKMHGKGNALKVQHKFEASQRFPSLLCILITTAKKKWQCGMSMIQLVPETEIRSVTFSQCNARNFNTSDLLSILGVVHRGVCRGSPWTGPQVVHRPGPYWGSVDRGSVFSGYPL